MKQLLPLLLLVLLALSIRAEDWTTTDGKTYKNVKVLKVEPDIVTIMHSDGGGTVELATLPFSLQQRFGYDPAKAKAAADARGKADLENIKALQAEKDKMNARDIASTQAIAAANAKNSTTNSSVTPAAPPDHLNSTSDKEGPHFMDGPRDRDHTDPTPHYMGI